MSEVSNSLGRAQRFQQTRSRREVKSLSEIDMQGLVQHHIHIEPENMQTKTIRWNKSNCPPQVSATRLLLWNWCWCDYVAWIPCVDGYSSAVRAWQLPQIHCGNHSHA